ncbi:MAG: M28 family peptidase [Kiritimatiellaeota bacterium]|nr:M28 family peptidase [Kiritimatiellota bacterium]
MKLIFLYLLPLLFLAGCNNQTPPADWRVLPKSAGEETLAIAGEFLRNSPRDSGTVGAAKASRWLAAEIQKLGLKAQTDSWVEDTDNGKIAFSNVFVDFPGETPNIVLFGSHYDTKSGISDDFQGANDGGSSTAVLLRLIRHFAETKPRLQSTVRFAFFDGEECIGKNYTDHDGLHGSKRMALRMHRKRLENPVAAVIILDMVGDADQRLQIPRNVTPWLANLAMREASEGRADIPHIVLADTAMLDDHWPFALVGFPVIDLIDFEYGSAHGKNDYWHTHEDTLDKLSADSLWKAANIALALLARIEDGRDLPPEIKNLYPAQHDEH